VTVREFITITVPLSAYHIMFPIYMEFG